MEEVDPVGSVSERISVTLVLRVSKTVVSNALWESDGDGDVFKAGVGFEREKSRPIARILP